MKILFLTPYPLKEAPSQRFRFEQYFQLLNKEGHQYAVRSFLQANSWRAFYTKGKTFQKLWLLLLGFLDRVGTLFTLMKYEAIFIHRETAPIGPPIFEWIIAKILNKKIIYDFDDAIWMTDKINEGYLEKVIRWRRKVGTICQLSYKVSCGNEYLADYAHQYNTKIIINPTTIDTNQIHNKGLLEKILKNDNRDIIIGWTGSHSTLKYLKNIEGILRDLENHFDQVRFLIIADSKPELGLQRMDFIPWNKETEVTDLLRMDIGIMPLPDDEWTKGKCGFKALQYMSLEIPCVVSPIGVNNKIVEHGISGYFAKTEIEWLQHLKELILNPSLRKKMGSEGRKKVMKEYSVQSNSKNFLSLFSQ